MQISGFRQYCNSTNQKLWRSVSWQLSKNSTKSNSSRANQPRVPFTVYIRKRRGFYWCSNSRCNGNIFNHCKFTFPDMLYLIHINDYHMIVLSNLLSTISIKILQVNFFMSPNLLLNFTDHTKVVRLYPRPIVTIKTNSFMNTKPNNSRFLTTFSTSQVS